MNNFRLRIKLRLHLHLFEFNQTIYKIYGFQKQININGVTIINQTLGHFDEFPSRHGEKKVYSC